VSAPQHGTWQRYVNKRIRCRCEPCREAWRAYQNNRNRAIAYGRHEPAPLVDAAPARDHLNSLRAAGYGTKALAAISGIHRTHLEDIRSGKRATVWQSTLDDVLAITVDPDRLPDRADVDGVGTRRRLRALVAVGWSMALIAERLGCRPENVRQIINAPDERRVTAATRRAVCAVYDELWDVRPPSFTAVQRSTVGASLNRAAKRGWLPPLAWDDDTIDDPKAIPDTGARSTLPNGGTGRPAEHVVEDVQWYLDHVNRYATPQELSDRFGYREPNSLYMVLKRAGETEMRDRIIRNGIAAGAKGDLEKVGARRKGRAA
jgi:transcriptional regulator with XRE-family HTH domain